MSEDFFVTLVGIQILFRLRDFKTCTIPLSPKTKDNAECEEYGMDRMYLVRELMKLGLVAWNANEEEEDDEAVTLLGD